MANKLQHCQEANIAADAANGKIAYEQQGKRDYVIKVLGSPPIWPVSMTQPQSDRQLTCGLNTSAGDHFRRQHSDVTAVYLFLGHTDSLRYKVHL